jgi:23S rRNA pseudouridine2604 synthase
MSDFSHADDTQELYSPRIRLNKFLADRGICSRRDADLWIESGRVTVNGELVDVGTFLDDSDEVRVDGELIAHHKKPKRVYIALHKPIGVECTTDQRIDGNIVDFVQHQERVFPIGRLDKDSDGLILLTNDGDIVNKILRAEHNHEKEYWVTVDRKITADFLSGMANGVQILRRKTRPCRTYKMSAQTFGIVLTEGMNRQIRKMSEAFGYRVQKLTRVRIMNVEIGHLKVGRWRNLTPVELAGLLKAIQQPKAETASPRGTRAGVAGARSKPAVKALYQPRDARPARTGDARPARNARIGDARPARSSDSRPARSSIARPARGEGRPIRDAQPAGATRTSPWSKASAERSDARKPARSGAVRSVDAARPVRAGVKSKAASSASKFAGSDGRREFARGAKPGAAPSALRGDKQPLKQRSDSTHPSRSKANIARTDKPMRSERAAPTSPRSRADAGKRMTVKDLGWDD